MTEAPKDQQSQERATPKTAYRLLALVRGKPAATPEERTEQVLTFPHLVGREVLAAMLFLAILVVASLLFNAPLEAQADPARTPNPAKAPWYFAGLQELLTYFDPWLAGVALPAVIIIGLFLIPYLDLASGRGIGRWFAWRERRIQIVFFSACLAFWFFLVAIGVWFRGPAWEWYWPWESWEIHKESKVTLSSLPQWAGLLVMSAHLLGGMAAAWALRRRRFQALPALNYYFSAAMLVLSLGVPLKMVFRFVFDIKYILVTPWFNI